MNYRPTLRFFLIILLFLALVKVEIFILLQFNNPDKPEISNIHNRPTINPLMVRGLKIHIFQGDHAIRIKADEFEVSPRKFAIFSVNRLNEFTLNNVTVEFNINENKPVDKNIADIRQVFSSLVEGGLSSPDTLMAGTINAGLITRGVYNDLLLKIYRNRSVELTVNAKKAIAEFNNSKIQFYNAVIEDMKTKEIIRSRLVTLEDNADHFCIPDQYVKLSPSGVIRGKGLQIRLHES